jgi:hypothetical protein
METKPQKPSLLFTNPFALWTEFAFKLWGLGEPALKKQVAVAVIPTSDAKPPKRTKQKVRGKTRSKRAKR